MPNDIDLQFSALSSDLSTGKLEHWQQFWHFDRHITGLASNSAGHASGGEPEDIHPLFHFHFGGDKLETGRKTEKSAWGKLLELKAPRIAHPPLDLILLIDFILSNFSGKNWRRLLSNEKEYGEIVSAAQRRFWFPCKAASHDYYRAGQVLAEKRDHAARALWPSLAY